jgi:hypothetical protein
MLSENDFETPRAAADGLGQLGPMASEAIHELRQRAQNPNEDAIIRISAARALWKVSGDAAEAVPLLVDCLNSNMLVYGSSGLGGESDVPSSVPNDVARQIASKALVEISGTDRASKELVRRSVRDARAHADNAKRYDEILDVVDRKD